jgi:hypothetical protein
LSQNQRLSRTNLKTPKAAAIAGMVFSSLTIAAFWLLIVAVPADPQEPGSGLAANSNSVELGLIFSRLPEIAFLWFIGVPRPTCEPQESGPQHRLRESGSAMSIPKCMLQTTTWFVTNLTEIASSRSPLTSPGSRHRWDEGGRRCRRGTQSRLDDPDRR